MAAATILVVDDEPGVRSLLRRCLEGDGYAVIESEDISDVLSRVREGGVDLAWNAATEPDFYRYYIYRAGTSGGEYELLNSTTANIFADLEVEIGVPYYYVVTSLDDAENESTLSAEVSATALDDLTPPVVYYIYP